MDEKDSMLLCPSCGSTGTREGAIVWFCHRDEFYGELTRPQMKQLLELAEREGWRDAVATYVTAVNPGLVRTIEHPHRLNGILDAGPSLMDAVVLDYGCGLGGVCIPLAGLCKETVGVDGCLERLRFTALRAEQEGLEKLTLVLHDDAMRLPFPDHSFDLAILNLVLPYLPSAYPDMSRWSAERAILAEFRRVIRPGGVLYLAERNRTSVYCWSRLGLPTTTRRSYGHRQYLRLLREAGFSDVSFRWLIPDYKTPSHVIDLDQPYHSICRELDAVSEFPKIKKTFFKFIARVSSYWMAHVLGIVARA
ncbi:class I SAM-dependent methyltransferase [Deferrisoma camini]|uniref:class I SAM-dependent methyltransferase n=1 Tax=Deferrisoma camini TaxID=1035120 RepID=UPI00146B24DF|nr:class I SAM-dependent methyltransferase [Deferrisoma camini]